MPNSDLKVLGEKVRKERKLAGLTQEQLAEHCHVSTKHIANIEKGSMNPSYEILLAIARVLPISLDALITPGMDKTEIELKEMQMVSAPFLRSVVPQSPSRPYLDRQDGTPF